MIRYPGGKSKISKQIIEKLKSKYKDDDNFVELFVGGNNILPNFLKIANPKNILINDKDEGIIALWKSIIFNPEPLKELIQDFTPTIESFYSFKKALIENQFSDIVIHGFMKLVIHQISYSGLGTKSGGPLGGREQKSKYKVNCRWNPYYICVSIDKMHNLFKRQNITCVSQDFEECNCENALIYADPPYYVKGNELYQEGFAINDHIRLANFLKDKKFILSYDDAPEIRELYAWANIEEIDIKYTIKGARSKKELIIF